MQSHDYEEFIGGLNRHNVRYLIVGAHAVAHHARPRATKDLDLFVDPTDANATRVLAAMKDFFGGTELGYTTADLTNPGWIVQLGVAPVRIDIMSRLDGCADFRSAWANRVESTFGGQRAFYIGLEELIAAKRKAGRLQDRADVRALQRARTRRG